MSSFSSNPADSEALRTYYQAASRENSAYGCGVALTLLLTGAATVGVILAGLTQDARSTDWFSGTSSPADWGAIWLIVVVLWAIVITGLVFVERRRSARRSLQLQQMQQLREEKFRALTISNIDSMTGLEFEHYLDRILRAQGFDVRITKGSGDLGVDLIASRANDSVAIQVKRYGSKISRRAVSDAVAGMRHYRCSRAMVVTNSYFTPGAMKLAASNNCTLVDRNTLADWVRQYQSSGLHTRTSQELKPQPPKNDSAETGGDSTVTLICDQCGQCLRVPRMSDRLRIRCPKCGNSFLFHT